MAATVVSSLAVAGANAPLTITPSSGTGAVTITSNIPTYSASDGITMVNESGSPPNFDFRGTYENIAGGQGITFSSTGNSHTISANIASIATTGRGITTITDENTGEVEINADIAGFNGPVPGITFSGPDMNGIMTITPNICDVVQGAGIIVSRPNANPTAVQVAANVADVTQGAGIGISKNTLTNVYTVSADVADVTSTLASGILVSSNAQNVYSPSLNLYLPSTSGLQTQTSVTGLYEIDANYNNLLNGVGTTVVRTPGQSPSAQINATVASLTPVSKGITAQVNTSGVNEWVITNTGVIAVDSASPAIGVSTDPTSGIATLTFNPSQTFADNQVLNGSMQVPILVGGKIQGSHFNGYLTYGGNTIQCIQPKAGALNPGDCLISAGANVFSVSNGVITGSGLQGYPGITGFTYLTLNQQAPGVPSAPAQQPFNTDVYFFSYYESQAALTNGSYSGYQVAAYSLDGGGVARFFSLYSNDYAMVPANGIAVNANNMYSLLTGSAGMWIGLPYQDTEVNYATLLQNGFYSNPVITRVYNRQNVNDGALMNRARCFCTQEGGGLVEIQMSTGAPFFSSPTPVVGSPTSSGWLPLKVVPLENQWIDDGSTDKFNYLIYMSNSIITVVYNTLTQTWSGLNIPGYVGAFSNRLITSIADPGDTIYSQYLSGGLVASDLPTLPSGSFPMWSASSQTASVFFPVALNFQDVITFGSSEGYLFQSTFTPDVTEIVSNILQIKAVDELEIVTAGDCAITSDSLEITNTAMTLTTGNMDVDCGFVSVNTGVIYMMPGTQLYADQLIMSDQITTPELTVSPGGSLSAGLASSMILPQNLSRRQENSNGTNFIYAVPQMIGFTVPMPNSVVEGQWSLFSVPFPPGFQTLSPMPAVTISLTGYSVLNQIQTPQFDFQYNAYFAPFPPPCNIVYGRILWTNGTGLNALQQPTLSIFVSG